ncbi:MAG: hypothetical protein IJ461_05455 [Clostridia bacterium]|nr:hypothetical protein [Clostridia bacterium]
MQDVTAVSLNKKRNRFRTLTMICLCVEILAVVLMFTSHQVLGLVIGLASFAGYFVITRMGKRQVNDAVAQAQMKNLGLDGCRYLGRLAVEKKELAEAELLPSRCVLDTPVFQHGAVGQMGGRELTVGEITLSFPKKEGKQNREFNSGAFVVATLTKPLETPLVLLGNKPFMISLTRQDYANDGYTQCPIGGKNKGWYAFTPGNAIPDEKITQAWEALCEAAGGQAAMAVKGDKVYAFFCGLFTTETFQLSEEIAEADLKKRVFPHLPLLTAVLDAME